MQINNISQAMQGELRKVDGTARKQDRDKPVSRNDASDRSDRSDLSANGKMQREAKGDMQIISSMVKAQPDVRAEKVTETRMKIGMGVYNSEDFAERLAAKLASTLV